MQLMVTSRKYYPQCLDQKALQKYYLYHEIPNQKVNKQNQITQQFLKINTSQADLKLQELEHKELLKQGATNQEVKRLQQLQISLYLLILCHKEPDYKPLRIEYHSLDLSQLASMLMPFRQQLQLQQSQNCHYYPSKVDHK